MTSYTVMCSKKSSDTRDWFAPMSYGRGNEPAQDQLLMRGRATLFDSEREAMEALQVSLLKAKESGGTWMGKHNYSVVECNAPHTPALAVLMRCGLCSVNNGKLPPTKYIPIKEESK